MEIHSKSEGHTREGSESSAVDTPSIEFIFSSSETTNEEDLWIDPDPGGICTIYEYIYTHLPVLPEHCDISLRTNMNHDLVFGL